MFGNNLKTNEMRTSILIVALSLGLQFSYGQSPVKTVFTDALFQDSYKKLHIGTSESHKILFEGVYAQKLANKEADCFILTFEITPEDASSASGNELPVVQFEQNNLVTFSLGTEQVLKGNQTSSRWFIDFQGPSKTVRYTILDDLGALAGKYTIIASATFLGIAKDADNEGWYFSPVFFGLDTNKRFVGGRVMDEYIGISALGSNPTITLADFIENPTATVFMMADADKKRKKKKRHPYKLSDVIYRLNNLGSEDHTINLRSPEEGKLTELEREKELEHSYFFIFPNPSNGLIYINRISPFERQESLRLQLFDSRGKLISIKDQEVFEGYNGIRWDLSSNPALENNEIYVLKIESSFGTESHRLFFERN